MWIWDKIEGLKAGHLTDQEIAQRILEDPDYADYSYQQIMDLISQTK